MDAEHVICHDGTKGSMAYALECTHCGDVQRVALPISIDCWLAMAQVYGKVHANCRKAETTENTEETKQGETNG